jgi:hypothetical protein
MAEQCYDTPDKHLKTETTINRNRNLDLYNANIAFTIDGKGQFNIVKSRYGLPKRNLSLIEIVDLFSTLLAKARFKGIAEVFEEGMKQDLKESMKNVINKYKGGGEFDTF